MKAEDYFKVEKRKESENKGWSNSKALTSFKSFWRNLWKGKRK